MENGQLIECQQVDDQQQPMSYVQLFTLLPESGSYFVFKYDHRIQPDIPDVMC